MRQPGSRTQRFVALFQALAIALGLQLSGTLPLVEEAVSFLVAELGEHGCCAAERERCHDCAPGCPACHCPSQLRSLVPVPGTELAAAPAARVGSDDRAARAPPGPEPRSVFRPPRVERVT